MAHLPTFHGHYDDEGGWHERPSELPSVDQLERWAATACGVALDRVAVEVGTYEVKITTPPTWARSDFPAVMQAQLPYGWTVVHVEAVL